MWYAEWGAMEEGFIEIQRKTGFTPPALARKPKLRPDSFGYLEAFNVLSGSRQWAAYNPQPLLISEMSAYCDVFGVPKGSGRTRFVRLVLRLDGSWLERYMAKAKSEREKNKSA